MGNPSRCRTVPRSRSWTLAVSCAVLLAGPAFAQITVTVRDDNGQPVLNGFRWLLEEDTTYGVTPGVPSPNAAWNAVPGNPSYTLGVNIHRSHAPVVCAGNTAPSSEIVTFPATPVTLAGPSASSVVISAANCPGYVATKKYFVSVLPWHTSPEGTALNAISGYTMSGRGVAIGQHTVNVIVHNFPVQTAQITVMVFADTQPINAAFDQPSELGLPGFDLILSDPIDRVSQDAFANPLGTTYRFACTMPDGRPAAGTRNGDGSVTCTTPPTPVLSGLQPLFELDAEGSPVVDWLGDGTLKTCPGTTKPLLSYNAYERANCIDPYTLTPLGAGEAVVRYLVGDKYNIEPEPPQSDPDWVLTGTLEGTRANDAWVAPREPRFNAQLGQLNWLVFYGFVKPMDHLSSVPNPSGAALGSITGSLAYIHDMHPPLQPGLSPGVPVENGYVGVNNLGGNDEQIYTAATDPQTGAFTINNVVPGVYQLAFWDKQINAIIDYRTVTVGAGQQVALGPVAIFKWFGSYVGSVFNDVNRNGFRNANERGLPSVPVNLHYTDGSLYGTVLTDSEGAFSFPQVFPWWRFLIADVDNTRFRPTGLTAYIDNGGPLPNDALGAQGINPQIQPTGLPRRTQLANASDPAITQAIQTFGDMTNRIDWGKVALAANETGGIHGIVNYAITRTEQDPATSATDPWEPAIPRVTVTLHQARKDLANGSAVSGYWVVADTPPFPLTTQTDSWDDRHPTGCVGARGVASQGPVLWPNPEIVNGFAIPSCAETFYNWNQVRPGVMDGAYYFRSLPGGGAIPPGNYIVQVTPPAGYEVLQWGDRDIDIGDPKTPFLTQSPPCVGATYAVPPYLRMFPDQLNPTDIPGGWDNDVWTNPQAARCDLKQIALNPGASPSVDFNLFTFVPKAARIWGTVWNDLMLEFNPRSPNASGNFGVPWIPVAIRDYTGVEVARFYTDQWGHFDGMVPANYDIVPPIAMGLALSMHWIVPNDPGPITDTRSGSPTFGQPITDPWFNPEYSQEFIREKWEFYSGKTTFIDTIVLPGGAFVGNRVPLSCDYVDRTPELRQVSEVVIPQTPGGYTITITAMGPITSPNPNYDPTDVNSHATITLDHGFGASGTVTVGNTTLPPANVTWAVDGLSVTAVIPNGVEGQLVLRRNDSGLSTTVGVTLHAASASVPVIQVSPPAASCEGLACRVIQPAIDAAPPGALIVINPGRYQENVNLWKPLTLQGKGAPVTIFDGTAAMLNFTLKEAQFNQLLALNAAGAIALVPGQASDFTLERGAGIMVGGCGSVPSCGAGGQNTSFFAPGASARIDGLTITGATEQAGGILINGYVANLKITNNEVFANQGSIAGGIRAGEPGLVSAANPSGGSSNPGLLIEHNRISQNGSLFSGGGGISLFAGADRYVVRRNMICGNFSAQYGGGIDHEGLSRDGVIEDNVIVSNESFDEGGGVSIGGELPAGATSLTPGTGSVLVRANLIQGNKAGDDGGGVRTRRVNGADVVASPLDPTRWFEISILDNLIVNNSSADSGGGIALDDTVRSTIIGNTIADNDSTATSTDSFGPCSTGVPVGLTCPPPEQGGGFTASVPAPGGVSSIAHSAPLAAALTAAGAYCASASDPMCAGFSNPFMVDDIVWHNRSFYWSPTANGGLGALLPAPGTGYWDFAVYGPLAVPTPPPGPLTLSPSFSFLTDGVGATASATNRVGVDPLFLAPYFNVYQATSKGAALGNFVVATFSPNGVQGDYHVPPSSPVAAAGSAIPPGTTTDFDHENRLSPVDVGADQVRH